VVRRRCRRSTWAGLLQALQQAGAPVGPHGRRAAGVVPGLPEPLSARELEVLHLLAGGQSNQAIAEELVITLDTVKRHVTHVLDKLGVTNRTRPPPAPASWGCCGRWATPPAPDLRDPDQRRPTAGVDGLERRRLPAQPGQQQSNWCSVCLAIRRCIRSTGRVLAA
jgi:DNA-binding CsgD family transcriptional regulator